MNNSIYQALGYIIGAALLLVGKSIFDNVFKYIKKRKANNIFKKSISTSSQINEQLSTIRDIYGFNRVSLIDYHNGTENFKGLSFKNASMRNEVIDVKTKPIISEFQNIPCSIMADTLIKLEESKLGYVISSDQGDLPTAITNKMFGIKHSYIFKLGKTLVDGAVNCVFTDEINNLSTDEILEIRAIIQRIYLIRNNKM